jgi:hypothetical protein
MKLSKITRFIRANLVGLLALLNVVVVFSKFKVENRITKITERVVNVASTKEKKRAFQSVSSPSFVPAVPVAVPPSHKVSGDWEGELKEVSCDYTSAIAQDVPILQTPNGKYLKRGDLTIWGRIKWIGSDFFTTDKCLVRLGVVSSTMKHERGGL